MRDASGAAATAAAAAPGESQQMRSSASIATWHLCLETLVSVTTKLMARVNPKRGAGYEATCKLTVQQRLDHLPGDKERQAGRHNRAEGQVGRLR